MDNKYNPPSDLGRFQFIAMGIGLIGILVWIVAVVSSGEVKETFFRTYLVAYVFWSGLALGCLGWLLLQYLGGATWGLIIRRLLESGAHTLLLMAVLFVPILFGLHSIYEWSHDLATIESEAARKLIEHKSAWLNPGFFALRAAVYFAIWLGLVYVLRRRSHKLDETGDPNLIQSAQNWSGPGFLLYGLACTFAAIDWVMSLDAEWYSTIFGLIMIAGQGLMAMAFIIAVCVVLSKQEPMSHLYQARHFHTLGKLLLALVMLWAYLSFSQLLIVWSGNLPEEIPWYLERFKGVWKYVGVGVLLLHFALPFTLLLSSDLKRNARRLVFVAGLMIVMRFVDLLWLIVPEFEHGHSGPASTYFIYIAATIGMGGLWLGWFFRQLRTRSLVPYKDPQLDEALAAAVGGHH
ncbi:MAG TPA: hypothetical protein VJ302_09045 [Blastocatellia bacterium]|nr:hypothetical protein [Blastocatellia bacterium]